MLDELDKKIICALQDEFPLVARPYQAIAEKLGITEAELMKRMEGYLQSGKIRKMGAVLRHREVGYAANALCAWVIPDERTDEIGAFMAGKPEITDCYLRNKQTGWRYNFYTMLHGHTRQQCQKIVTDLAREIGVNDYIMLFSTKEWKKTSMRYFREKR